MSHRILIVDDEPSIREILVHTFEMAGYTVDTASSGFEALVPLVDDQRPSLVIVGDLSPRPETSLALVNDIRVAFVGLPLPIIMLSTQATRSDITCGLAHGADRYLTKPFSVRDLEMTVKELLTDIAA